MTKQAFKEIINEAWENKTKDIDFAKEAVTEVLHLLDIGEYKIADKVNGSWVVNEWLKKAIILSFKFNNNEVMEDAIFKYHDKIPLKFETWQEDEFKVHAIRAVPGSIVRKSAYIGKNTVLMPSFINVGAYIGDFTMVDTWATIGSCAQIGKNCHISGGVGIGGVLEPLQANPVIIEDNCFIGARSEIAEGVIIAQGSVLAMGTFIGKSTKIYNRITKEISYGYVPPYSVVVPGSLSASDGGEYSLYAAIIVKQVDDQTRSKTSINELLRF